MYLLTVSSKPFLSSLSTLVRPLFTRRKLSVPLSIALADVAVGSRGRWCQENPSKSYILPSFLLPSYLEACNVRREPLQLLRKQPMVTGVHEGSYTRSKAKQLEHSHLSLLLYCAPPPARSPLFPAAKRGSRLVCRAATSAPCCFVFCHPLRLPSSRVSRARTRVSGISSLCPLVPASSTVYSRSV